MASRTLFQEHLFYVLYKIHPVLAYVIAGRNFSATRRPRLKSLASYANPRPAATEPLNNSVVGDSAAYEPAGICHCGAS